MKLSKILLFLLFSKDREKNNNFIFAFFGYKFINWKKIKILKKDCKIVLKWTGEKECDLVLENTGIKNIGKLKWCFWRNI